MDSSRLRVSPIGAAEFHAKARRELGVKQEGRKERRGVRIHPLPNSPIFLFKILRRSRGYPKPPPALSPLASLRFESPTDATRSHSQPQVCFLDSWLQAQLLRPSAFSAAPRELDWLRAFVVQPVFREVYAEARRPPCSEQK